MSIQLSIYAGRHQPKPEIEIRSEGDSHWLAFSYKGETAIVFHGRSRAQCQRLAEAWNAMWDEPAKLTGSPDTADALAFTLAGLPDRVVQPDPEPTYQEEREDREYREAYEDVRYRADMIAAGRGHLLK